MPARQARKSRRRRGKVAESAYRYCLHRIRNPDSGILSPQSDIVTPFTPITRLGLRDDAERYWRESLWLDLSNTMGNSALGVHPACMGSTWQALVFGFLGVRFTESGPVCDPHASRHLPAKWRAIGLNLAWRGRVHPIQIVREEIQ